MRFSLQQLFLLFLLMGIIGGLYSAVLRRPFTYQLSRIDVSADGNLLVGCNSQGWELIDLRSGRRKFITTSGGFMFSLSSSEISFCDNDTVAITGGFPFPGQVTQYSISRNEVIRQQVDSSNTDPFVTTRFDSSLITHRADNEAFQSDAKSGKASISFYRKLDLQRLGIRLSFPFSVSDVATNSNGTLAAIGTSGNQEKNRIWNLIDNKKTEEWSGDVEQLYFSPDDKHLLTINERYFRLLDLSTMDEIWSLRQEGQLLKKSAIFSPDGRYLVIGQQDSQRFDIVETDSGEVTASYTPEGGNWRIFSATPIAFSPDSQSFYVVGASSDKGIQVVDLATGRTMKTIGRFNRLLMAGVFSALLIGWAYFWHYFSSKPVQIQVESLSKSNEYASALAGDQAIHPRIEAVKDRLRLVRTLMAVGGVIAILWAVVPMFYGNMFFPAGSLIRVVWLSFSLLTGILAMTKGFGKGESFLRTVAAFQILNLCNMDGINCILGIISTIVLNQSEVRSYFELNKKLGDLQIETGFTELTG